MVFLANEEVELLTEIWDGADQDWFGPEVEPFLIKHETKIHAVDELLRNQLILREQHGKTIKWHYRPTPKALLHINEFRRERWKEIGEKTIETLRTRYRAAPGSRVPLDWLADKSGLDVLHGRKVVRLLLNLGIDWPSFLEDVDPTKCWVQPDERLLRIKSFEQLLQNLRQETADAPSNASQPNDRGPKPASNPFMPSLGQMKVLMRVWERTDDRMVGPVESDMLGEFAALGDETVDLERRGLLRRDGVGSDTRLCITGAGFAFLDPEYRKGWTLKTGRVFERLRLAAKTAPKKPIPVAELAREASIDMVPKCIRLLVALGVELRCELDKPDTGDRWVAPLESVARLNSIEQLLDNARRAMTVPQDSDPPGVPESPLPEDEIQRALLDLAHGVILQAKRRFNTNSEQVIRRHARAHVVGGVRASAVTKCGKRAMLAASREFANDAQALLARCKKVSKCDWLFARSVLGWLLRAISVHVHDTMVNRDKQSGMFGFGTLPPDFLRAVLAQETDDLCAIVRPKLAAAEAAKCGSPKANRRNRKEGPAKKKQCTGEDPTYEFEATAIPALQSCTARAVPKEARRGGVLILTAVDVELNSVLARMDPLEGQDSVFQVALDSQTYYFGSLGSTPVIALKCDPGSVGRDSAAMAIQDAARRWKPKWIISTGIAFGTRPEQQNIGDVLVSTKLHCYESERKGKHSVPRGANPEAGRTLKNRFKNMPTWKYARPDGNPCRIHPGGILSGEKLVADESFLAKLLRKYPEAIGGEMEGAGLYAAAEAARIYEWIVVKGICDWGDANKSDKHHALAAAAAVDLVHAVLSSPGALGKPSKKGQVSKATAKSASLAGDGATPANRWAPWGLVYQEFGARPFVTGPSLAVFKRAHPDRHVAAEDGCPPQIILERRYTIVGRVPDKDAVFLEPTDADHVQQDAQGAHPPLAVTLERKTVKITQARHDYDLVLELQNQGTSKLSDYRAEILVPKRVLAPETPLPHEKPDRATRTERCFEFRPAPGDAPVFPGEQKVIARIRYHFDDEIHDLVDHGPMWHAVVTVRFYFENPTSPIEMTRPLHELHEF